MAAVSASLAKASISKDIPKPRRRPQIFCFGLGGLAGYDVSKTMAVKRVLDGGEMSGEGFGRGTQRKVKTAAKNAGHIGIGLVGEFGN